MVLSLVRINITAMFAGIFKKYRAGKKASKTKIVLIVLLAVYAVGALMFSVGATFYQVCNVFFSAGLGWFYFALAGILVFALCFIGGVFMVQSQLFNARDNELLLSMPIKPSAILAGRLFALLISEYLFEAFIMIPVFVVLMIRGYISQLPAIGIVFFFAAVVLLPLFALAVGCLFGWLIALISSRMRGKNVITLALSLAFLGAYFWGYSKMMGYMTALQEKGAEIAEAVRRAVYPAYHLGVAIAEGKAASFLIFAACAVLPFLVMYALLSASFIKVATSERGARKVEYREKASRAAGARMSLLKRELSNLWATPMYILNTMLGAVALLVLAAVLIVRPELIMSSFEPGTGLLSFFDVRLAGVIVLAALCAINDVSAPSISIEGKTLWIIKSLPLTARDILMSKVALHLLVCGAPALIAGVVCIAVLPGVTALQAVLMLITPASVTLMFALLGVTLNLAFPRFDWINKIQPIKQGMSCMLTMFGGMALVAALAIVAFLLRRSIALDVYLLICTAVFIAASAALYVYLIGAGCRKFEEL